MIKSRWINNYDVVPEGWVRIDSNPAMRTALYAPRAWAWLGTLYVRLRQLFWEVAFCAAPHGLVRRRWIGEVRKTKEWAAQESRRYIEARTRLIRRNDKLAQALIRMTVEEIERTMGQSETEIANSGLRLGRRILDRIAEEIPSE